MQDKTVRWLVGLMLVSGCAHLALWAVTGQAWEGSVSLRKPALFGISGGLTLWSLGWVVTTLTARPWDKFWSHFMAWSLLGEVGLITLQYWRGVPSHFNHATLFDGFVERSMLTLILCVTLWITVLGARSMWPMQVSPTLALAIRAGMILLWLSCILGIGTSVLGQWNIDRGQPHETWGKAGVLKFPHGIALHAIQFLPLCAWLFERWRLPRPYQAMQGIVVSQLCFLLYAVWQTVEGRTRWDMDLTGAILFGLAVTSALLPLAANLWPQDFGSDLTRHAGIKNR